MAIENPYFTTLTEGSLVGKELAVKVVPTGRKQDDELRSILDQLWEVLPGNKWPNDGKPSRLRYEGYEVNDRTITIKVSPTVSYKDYATWEAGLTNILGTEFAPLAISVTTLIETADGKLVLTERKPEADYKPSGLSGVGGYVDINKDIRPDGTPDLTMALGREVHEETGLEPHELTGSTLHGVVYNPVSGSVDLVFWSKTYIKSKYLTARSHDEENDIVFLDINPDTLQNLVLTKTNAFTVGVLNLLIDKTSELMRKAGRGDYTEAIFRLRQVSYAEAIRRGPQVISKLEKRDAVKPN